MWVMSISIISVVLVLLMASSKAISSISIGINEVLVLGSSISI
jgi:hypothetical protein